MTTRDPRFLLTLLAMTLSAFGCAAPPEAPADDASAPAAAQRAWPRVEPAAGLPQDRALNVGFLILDGVYNTELTAPYDIFHHTRFQVSPGMEVFTVSPDGGRVRTFEGLVVEAHYGFADAPPIDVLVVPSAEGNMDKDLEDEELIAWVRKTGEKATYVVSLCDGAFLLAKAGLLDGVASTTFPGDQDSYAEMFPDLDLRRGPSFVHDGKALTSQGGAKSFDVALYLVDVLYGEEVASKIAGGLVLPWPPIAEELPTRVVAERREPPLGLTDRAVQVGFLLVDGVYNTELTAPYDIFHHTIFHASPGMRVFTVSADGGVVTTFEGLRIDAHHSFADAPPIDVLVVPSADASRDADRENEELVAWVRERGEGASYVVSLCWGAFLLAEAGLLDDHACTTFPSDQERFAETFPQLEVERGVSFVHDGKALTSAGGARSFEVSMYLADLLYGEEAARGIGKGMVIAWPPAVEAVEGLVIVP